MAGWTNKGKRRILEIAFRNSGAPTNFYVALATAADAPTPDTNTLGELTEIAPGNGYPAGGVSLNRNSTDFDQLNEDDVNDQGSILIKDLVLPASGGSIPASGGGARYALLTDDNVTLANREVYAYWDLLSNRIANDGQSLTLRDLKLALNES